MPMNPEEAHNASFANLTSAGLSEKDEKQDIGVASSVHSEILE